MKKINKKKYLLEKRKQVEAKKNEIRQARMRQHQAALNKRFLLREEMRSIIQRANLKRNLYKKRNFVKGSQTIVVKDHFGIEKDEYLSDYIQYSQAIANSNRTEITIDLTDVVRIWPSAVTFLCSFAKWIELTTRLNKVTINSIRAKDEKVNSYLKHCGFYDYVKIRRNIDTGDYRDDEVVKILRQKKKSDYELREDEIINLISKYSSYSEDDIERINSYILTEIFTNVTEHGVYDGDVGWWILAQYHKTSGFITLCVADNGIGIRNSLATGPQANIIKKELSSEYIPNEIHDGIYIKKACESNISGALHASIPKRNMKTFMRKRYKSGSRRGNGLKRIKDKCKDLGIRLSIVSHKGIYVLDNLGNEVLCMGFKEKIFAGTMYQLTIETKKVTQ